MRRPDGRSDNRVIRVVKQLKGTAVLNSDSRPLGFITDALVHPTEGRLSCLLMETATGVECAIAADECTFSQQPRNIITSEFAVTSQSEPATDQTRQDVVPVCRELIGTHVVTETGELLGYVSEVLLQLDTRQTVYQVAAVNWRRLFGLGFYLAGDVPRFYSRFGSRLIVPAETLTQFATKEFSQVKRFRNNLATPSAQSLVNSKVVS